MDDDISRKEMRIKGLHLQDQMHLAQRTEQLHRQLAVQAAERGARKVNHQRRVGSEIDHGQEMDGLRLEPLDSVRSVAKF